MNEQLQIIITAQIDKLKQNVDKAKKDINSFKEQVQKASKEVDSKFQAIGQSMANGAKAAAVGLAAAGGALLALGASTAEYRNEQAKLVTAFETAGASAETAKETYNDLFRVLGDSGQATEAAGHLAKLTTEEKALSEWTNICQGVYATFGDSLPIEGLTEAANETAKVGTVTGSLADALNWAGINEDAFNESLAACNTEAEREKLIRETLNGLYSEASANFEKNNAEVLAQNEAQGKLNDTMAALGEAVAPVITAFNTFAHEALAAVMPHIEALVANYGPALESALSKMAELVGKVVGFIVHNWGVISTIAAVIGGIAAAITLYNTVAAIKAAMAAAEVTTVWGLVAAYAAQAAAMIVAIAPYLLIVAAIAAVIAIIVLCVKHWDKITEAVGKAWDWIKQKTEQAVEAVVGWFNKMRENISKIGQAIGGFVKEKFTQIKETMGNMMQAAKDTVAEKLQNMKQAYNEHGGGIKGIAAAAMEGVKGYYSAGYDFINKLTGGKLGELVGKARDKMNQAKQAISNVLNQIKEKFSSILNSAKEIVYNGIEKIKSFFHFKWELPKLKMPHFEVSGKFSLNPLSVPKFSISWNKLGGVFDNPTLFNYGGSLQGIGENGAEAVVPLENNTEWLNKIANMLVDKMGVSRPVVLEVDGKVFAETAISTINSNTRQTGRLALNLV